MLVFPVRLYKGEAGELVPRWLLPQGIPPFREDPALSVLQVEDPDVHVSRCFVSR